MTTELALALAFYRQIRASAHFADLKRLLATMLVDQERDRGRNMTTS